MTTNRTTLTNARKYAAKHKAELQAAYDATPEHDDGFADWTEKNNIKPVARGLAQFKEFINRNGRPKAAETLHGLYIQLPRNTVEKLRAGAAGNPSFAKESAK
jgi:hypothetical protein